jgi:hypothetical protein
VFGWLCRLKRDQLDPQKRTFVLLPADEDQQFMVNTTELRKVDIKVDTDLVLQGGAPAPLTRRTRASTLTAPAALKRVYRLTTEAEQRALAVCY